MLVQGVARDLTKRGIKAIEAFGDAKFGDDADDPVRRLRRAGRLLPLGGLQDGPAAPALPAAAAGAAHGAELEVRRRVRAGEAARLDEPGDAAAAGPRPATRSTTAPTGPASAGSVERRCRRRRTARSSLTSIEPVGTSRSIGKYIRCTAATIASTTRSRNRGSTSRARSVRGGQVADLDPDRRHPGQPQQVPRLGVGAAVPQPGPGHDLPLHQPGQAFAGRRGDAVVGAVVVGGDALGGRVGVAVGVQRDEHVGAERVGQLRPGPRRAGSSPGAGPGSAAPARRRRRAAPPAGWPGRAPGPPRSSAAARRAPPRPGRCRRAPGR